MESLTSRENRYLGKTPSKTCNRIWLTTKYDFMSHQVAASVSNSTQIHIPCWASFASLRIELGVPGGVGCGVVFGEAWTDPLLAVVLAAFEHRACTVVRGGRPDVDRSSSNCLRSELSSSSADIVFSTHVTCPVKPTTFMTLLYMTCQTTQYKYFPHWQPT